MQSGHRAKKLAPKAAARYGIALAIAAGAPGPVNLVQLLKEREEAAASFRNPHTSPLAAVARHEFPRDRPLVFGSAPGCDVQLDGVAPNALQISALADHFETGEGTRLEPGSRVELGRYTLRLSHQNFPAVVVLDPDAPRLKTGPFPVWFDPDPGFRVAARLVRDSAPREEVVLSTRGNRRRALRLGKLEFVLQGKTMALSALRLLEPGQDESAVSIFFRDATTGHESYEVGRYVDAESLGGDEYALDFNRAYNPTCAFSPLYNCPIPPRENVLPVAVRAGERNPH
ncbi:MAG: DUF1684 domain-containing protein [Myxococcales bacterium]